MKFCAYLAGWNEIDNGKSTSEIIDGRFHGLIAMVRYPHEEVEDLLSSYDFWEPYQESKCYSARPYQAAFTGVTKTYTNMLVMMKDDDTREETTYVCAMRVSGELDRLAVHCPCLNCNTFWSKYIWCNHCCGCLKTGPLFASKENIEKAKETMENMHIEKKSYLINALWSLKTVILGVVIYWIA